MDDFYLQNPSILVLPNGIETSKVFSDLESKLAYTPSKENYVYLKWREAQKMDDIWLQGSQTGYRHWFVQKYGRDALNDKVNETYNDKFKSCLFQKDGRYCTYSGLVKEVEEIIGKTAYKPEFISPKDWKCIPWENIPDFKPRYYQQEALDALCPEDGSLTHGGVNIGTGLGKSYIIALLLKRIGLQAVLAVPNLSIGNQMIKDLRRWFGVGKVGQFFDGKKQADRLFVVATAQSLARITEDSQYFDSFSNRKVVVCDESHTTPPDSLSTVMFNLLQNVPYRYFFSGTNFRTDGLELLLHGIIKDVVYEMSVREGIEKGFLSPLRFFQWQVRSESNFTSSEMLKMNKKHFLENPLIYKHAAQLVNRAVIAKNRRVLVLIDHVDQFQYLINGGLTVPRQFAHGTLTEDNKPSVPKEYWKSDPSALVDAFDRGEFPVLVGTSCIGMGTDIKSVDCIVSLTGSSSEIEIPQNAGRGTRLFANKKDCVYNDYGVVNVPVMANMAAKRRRIFDSIYGTCQTIMV
jgi:superfamily II DNA or RNA helicase